MSDTLNSKLSYRDNVWRAQISNKLTILDITEDCTRLVFDRLTLNQLIHLRAVCHAWNDIITDICQYQCELRLFFGNGRRDKDSSEYYDQITHRLNINDSSKFQINGQIFLSISQQIQGTNSSEAFDKRTGNGSFRDQQNDPNPGIRFLSRLFPNITNFVCDIQFDRMFELIYILWKWSINLYTLTIHFNNNNNPDRNTIYKNAHEDFVKCFEHMRLLRQLHLFGINDQLDLLKFSLNIRTFGQLEEFTFDCPNLKFAQYFAQLDPNRLKLLRVADHLDSLDSLPNPLETNAELAFKLTHLSTGHNGADRNHISRHLAEFKNLIQLEITYIDSTKMATVLKKMLPLKKLETFVLYLHLFEMDDERKQYGLNRNYRNTFPIFHNTITTLHLVDRHSCCLVLHFQECQLLARTFPRVRKIEIYCISIDIDETIFDAQVRPRFSEAFGQRVELIFHHTHYEASKLPEWRPPH